MPDPSPAAAARKPPQDKLSAPARALHKLGLARDIDLALHLPMRYVDETRIAPIATLRDGDMAQVQGRVIDCRVETRSRRQLVVRLADDSGELVLRLLHFYPSQQKTLAAGQCVRARGEVRGGFFGREMVHPEFRAVAADAPLPQALTPVYPGSAQLPQAYLRKAVAGGDGFALGDVQHGLGDIRGGDANAATSEPYGVLTSAAAQFEHVLAILQLSLFAGEGQGGFLRLG